MVDIDAILRKLLDDCSKHLRLQQEHKAEAIFVSVVDLAVIYPPTNKIIDCLYDFATLSPHYARHLFVIEDRFSKKQSEQLMKWKLSYLNTKIAIAKASTQHHRPLFK